MKTWKYLEGIHWLCQRGQWNTSGNDRVHKSSTGIRNLNAVLLDPISHSIGAKLEQLFYSSV